MTEFERRKDMVNYLYKHRKAQRQELADRYEVSTRTIDRDILYLSRYYAINTKIGAHGGIYIENGAVLYNECLTPYEEGLLRKIMSSMDKEDAETLESIITKFGGR